MSFDTDVKLHLYGHVARTTRVPKLAKVAEALGASVDDVRAATRRLADQRLLALELATGEIRMAPPFSAVPSPFETVVDGKTYFANCIWDAFGIAAALHANASIVTSCGDCGDQLEFHIRGNEPEPAPGIFHYAVPAAHWWDDIVYT